MDNPKKVWQGINTIIHKTHDKGFREIFINEDGNIITDQKGVSNKFNKFFTNIANNLLKDLGEPNTKFQDYLKNPNANSLFLKEIEPFLARALIIDINILVEDS